AVGAQGVDARAAGGEEAALGIEDVELARDAVLVAKPRKAQRLGERDLARRLGLEALARARLRGEGSADLAEGCLSGLLIWRERRALARLRRRLARLESAAGKDGLGEPDAYAPQAGARAEEARKRHALAAQGGREADGREHLGSRDGHAGVRRRELPLRLHEVRAPQEQLRRNAGGEHGRLEHRILAAREGDALLEHLARRAPEQHGEHRLFLLPRALERRQLRARRCGLRLELAELELGEQARLEAPPLQRDRFLAQLHGPAEELDLLVERPQRKVRLRDRRSEREPHRLARRLARLQLRARSALPGAQAAEEVDLVGEVERRPIRAELARRAGRNAGGPPRDPLARGARPRVQGGREERLRLAKERARLVHARGGDDEVGIVRARFLDQRIELRLVEEAPPAAVRGIAGRALLPCLGQLDLRALVGRRSRAARHEKEKNQKTPD